MAVFGTAILAHCLSAFSSNLMVMRSLRGFMIAYIMIVRSALGEGAALAVLAQLAALARVETPTVLRVGVRLSALLVVLVHQLVVLALAVSLRLDQLRLVDAPVDKLLLSQALLENAVLFLHIQAVQALSADDFLP